MNTSKQPTFRHMRFAIWAGLTVILTLTGPFGTHEHLSMPVLAVSWGFTVAFSMVMVPFLRRVIYPRFAKYPAIIGEIVAMAAFSTVASPVFWLLFVRDHSETIWTGTPMFGLQVFLVAATISMIRHTVQFALMSTRAQPVEEPAEPARPRLLERIGAAAQTTVLSISADNHYVSVLLSDGHRERVLMRLGDAIAEMDDTKGVQVHRSHWVAQSALRETGRIQGRDHVWLTDGTSLPVSRSGRDLLQLLDLPERVTEAAQQDIAAQ